MSREIWCSVGITKNLGNYESMRVDAGAKRVIAEFEDEPTAWTDLWKEVEDQIEVQLAEINENVKAK